MNTSKLNVDQELFSGKRIDDIVVLSFKEKPLLLTLDLSIKKVLFDYLDLVASCDEVNVLLINEPTSKMKREEFIAFYKEIMGSDLERTSLYRMYNAVGQYILNLMGFNKTIVHANSGDTILLYMNISLACDYRIVADNTVFQNPNMEIGLIPKGGSSFLLSKVVGSRAASKILLSSGGIAAEEARHLGVVDQVVPFKELDTAALEVAQSFARIPSGYAVGVKKLLNYGIKEFADFLEYENKLLRKLLVTGKLGRERVYCY